MTDSSVLLADEYYSGGVTVEIDREVRGYLWVEDATVSLLSNAHIMNDSYLGDIYAASGAVINIYGGQIDNVLMISTMYNGLPDPVVTVYGTDFAVGGVPVTPGTTELFLQSQMLSGVYADGTEFAFVVDCFREGEVMMMIRLHWVDTMPLPEANIEAADVDFGEAAVGGHALQTVSIANTGNADLTVTSIVLEDETAQFFISGIVLPAVLEPDAVMQVWMAYIPAAQESAAAVLRIVSNDPDAQEITVALSGLGVAGEAAPEPLTPLEQMSALLEYFDRCVDDGTIYGIGQGKSGVQKLKALRNLLETAQNLIEHNNDMSAAKTLDAAAMKTDDKAQPGDFVAGENIGELNQMICRLSDALKGV